MSTRIQTICMSITPGDAAREAELVAERLRASGEQVKIGVEYQMSDGNRRRAGMYAVDLVIGVPDAPVVPPLSEPVQSDKRETLERETSEVKTSTDAHATHASIVFPPPSTPAETIPAAVLAHFREVDQQDQDEEPKSLAEQYPRIGEDGKPTGPSARDIETAPEAPKKASWTPERKEQMRKSGWMRTHPGKSETDYQQWRASKEPVGAGA